jgi:hypothetical protein
LLHVNVMGGGNLAEVEFNFPLHTQGVAWQERFGRQSNKTTSRPWYRFYDDKNSNFSFLLFWPFCVAVENFCILHLGVEGVASGATSCWP